MKFYVLTLFPQMIMDGLNHSILKRALAEELVHVECVNIRDFSANKSRRVDDYPYGGGAGMVMMPGPVYDAYQSVMTKAEASTRVVYLTPQGRLLNQSLAKTLSMEKELILLCGHYEGIDERVIETIVTDEISIGDYIMTGGELGAMVLVDTVSRLLPGVLGKEESFMHESFTDGLLEYPQYTRPPEFRGMKVPEILLSGHHRNIDDWRKEQSLRRTRVKRPDILTGQDS